MICQECGKKLRCDVDAYGHDCEVAPKYDVKEEFWITSKEPNAKKIRDARARELRKQGWTVKSETDGFSDLARCTRYGIYATRKR